MLTVSRRDEVRELVLPTNGSSPAELLLFLSAPPRFVALEPLAAAIWRFCDGRRSLCEVSEALAQVLGQTPYQSFSWVEEAARRLVDEGAMSWAPGSRHESARDPRNGRDCYELSLSVIGRRATVSTNSRALLDALRSRFRLLGGSPNGTIGAHVTIRKEVNGYRVLRDGYAARLATEPETAVAGAEMELVAALMERAPGLFWLHAGGAVRDDRATLLIGERGAGKSTLSTQLCSLGWQYLSDEWMPVQPSESGARALPFPVAPIVREALTEALPQERIPEIRRYAVNVGPEQVRREPATIARMVFPQWSPGAELTMRPCTPGETATRLLEHCRSFPFQGATAVPTALELASKTLAFRLTFGDGRAAAALLDRVEAEASHQHSAAEARRWGPI